MAESHVVSALKAKRAELAGEVQVAEKRIAQLRADLLHLDAVLRLFDPTAEPDTIPARRPYKRRGWFGNGELPRRILDALRASPEPLSASEITRRVMTAKGLDAGDTSTVELIRKSVAAYLRNCKNWLGQANGRQRARRTVADRGDSAGPDDGARPAALPRRADASTLTRACHPGAWPMTLGTILLIILILLLIGAAPAWPYSRGWGYAPGGLVGLVLIIVLLLILTGRI